MPVDPRLLQRKREGDPVSATEWNLLVDLLQREVRGPNVIADATGWTVLPAYGGAAMAFEQLRVIEEFNDYLRCHSWDGSVEGTTDIYVAKPYMLRHVLSHYAIITHLTTLAVYSIRVDDKDDANPDDPYTIEDWAVTPPYFNDTDYPDHVCEIWAVETDTGVTRPVQGEDDEPVTLLDINYDARAWAQKAYV